MMTASFSFFFSLYYYLHDMKMRSRTAIKFVYMLFWHWIYKHCIRKSRIQYMCVRCVWLRTAHITPFASVNIIINWYYYCYCFVNKFVGMLCGLIAHTYTYWYTTKNKHTVTIFLLWRRWDTFEDINRHFCNILRGTGQLKCVLQIIVTGN